MICPICQQTIQESNYPVSFNEDERLFYQEYFCFICYKMFVCTSQSGDMIEENLEEFEV